MVKKKITVTVSEELYNWCSELSESMGISVPALFVVSMSQYKQQQESIKAMGNMDILLKKLEEIEGSKANEGIQ